MKMQRELDELHADIDIILLIGNMTFCFIVSDEMDSLRDEVNCISEIGKTQLQKCYREIFDKILRISQELSIEKGKRFISHPSIEFSCEILFILKEKYLDRLEDNPKTETKIVEMPF